MRSLIVEDNLTERRLLEVLLRPMGVCKSAADGAEALMALTAAEQAGLPFDLICLDIRLPMMDGHMVLQAIRALESGRGVILGQGVKVIMTTGLGDAGNVLGAFQEQCDGYLVKPVDRKKLLKLLLDLHLLSRSNVRTTAV